MSTQPRCPEQPPAWITGNPERRGRYLLGPLLGQGGMGTVYEGWDMVLGRHVALKCFLGEGGGALVRFIQEAQFQAKLDHPNVCRVYDVDSLGDHPMIAMQLIQGPRLDEVALPPKTIAHLMIQVADAVQAAHRAKLIHRDLKPSNILLERGPKGEWIPYVCDFGLAMDMEGPGLTLTQGILGTPAYMAPEQLQGDRARIGPATDVYSLGVTLYRTLAGRLLAPSGGTSGLLDLKLRRDFPHPRQWKPELPKELDTIVMKCLEPEPSDRYPSAAALAEDLRRFLDGEAILACPVGPVTLMLRRIRRDPVASRSLTLAALLALGGLGWGLFVHLQAKRDLEIAQQLGSTAKDIEYLMRIERMLPPHDLRPAMERMRGKMNEIRSEMRRLGSQSRGPARLALARGHLALREYEAALGELDAAWAEGYRTPEMAYALGKAHCETFIARADREVIETGNDTYESLRREHLEPAKAYFRRATDTAWEPKALGEAQLASLDGRPEEALRLSLDLQKRFPQLYEAKTQEAYAEVALGFRAVLDAHREAVQPHFQRALEAARAAQEAARSDENGYHAEMNLRFTRIAHGIGGEDLRNTDFQALERLTATAHLLMPEHPRIFGNLVTLCRQRAAHEMERDRDPVPALQEGFRHLQEAKGCAALQPVILQKTAWLHLLAAEYARRSGGDPLPHVECALQAHAPGILHVQALCEKAEILLDRGQDPTGCIQQAMEALPSIKLQDYLGKRTFWPGLLETLQARWNLRTGTDPRAPLEAAWTALEAGERLCPRDPELAWYELEWCGTVLEAWDRGGDRFKGWERTSVGAARRLLALPAPRYLDLKAVADFGPKATRWAWRWGRPCPAAVALGRAALSKGLRAHPRAQAFRALAQNYARGPEAPSTV